MMKMRYFLPLIALVILVVFLAVGLRLNPREVPSPLIDRPAPEFRLPRLDEPGRSLSTADLRGKVWLLNVWASWCTACKVEHPLLLELAKSGTVPVYGLNYKDSRDAALGLLQQSGNPYVLSVVDADGSVGIDYGVYGVPETFLIDRDGVIRYKCIGPLTPEVLTHTILPMVRRLDERA
jgi:cytochrome c biogenesis protein CcmG/thiol:disulfide interchange protein DsbE